MRSYLIENIKSP